LRVAEKWQYKITLKPEIEGGRTVLINNFVCRRFPFLFFEHLKDNHIALNRPIHVFAANQQDGFGEGWYRDAPLTLHVSSATQMKHCAHFQIVVLISIEMALMQFTRSDTSHQHRSGKILDYSSGTTKTTYRNFEHIHPGTMLADP
jgi:hypothetical protein